MTFLFNNSEHIHSPSLPFGLEAALAKQRGQDAVKSIRLCSGAAKGKYLYLNVLGVGGADIYEKF